MTVQQWRKRAPVHCPKERRHGLSVSYRCASCQTWRACAAGGFSQIDQDPHQIVVGDNIPSSPQPIPQLENPRIRLIFKKQFVETVNRHGGNASLLLLPDVGIYGNTHAPFLDLNNLEVADLMSEFLHEKDLDDRDH
jgi:hypothetical protein